MRILHDFVMLMTDSCRSRAYIDIMHKKKIKPSFVILLDIPSVVETTESFFENSFFSNTSPLEKLLSSADIPYKVLKISTINDPSICEALVLLPQPYVIFSIPGYILGKQYFKVNKEFLHIHPGKLPEYKGSTPMYYSLLAEQKLAASALFLRETIDTGPIIAIKEFDLPQNPELIDLVYDPWMRASLLGEVLEAYDDKKTFNVHTQSPQSGETYYIIHPVLKAVALQKTAKPANRKNLFLNIAR